MKQTVKRILHFLPTLEVSSGSTTVAMNYYRQTDREKVQFDFLYFEDSDANYADEIEKMGGHVYRISKPDFTKTSISELKQFFYEHYGEWVALHCHPVYAAVAIGWIGKKNGIHHIIQHSHSSRFGNTKKSAIRNYILSRWNFLIADHYYACSEDACRLLGWKWFYKNKVQILNNAIDCERFRFDPERRKKIRASFQISDDTILIGHSGRFSTEKNHSLLINIFSEYHKLNPKSRLMLLGDGEEKETIVKQIQTEYLDEQVILLGRRDNPEDYLCAMDYFVFPSLYEGLSLALVEAQCNGIPCFVSENVDRKTKQIEQYYEFAITEEPSAIARMLPKDIMENDRLEAYEILETSNLNLKNEARKLEEFYLQIS